MGEFDLIGRYFTRATPNAVMGVGDDCALLAPKPGMHWAVSSDMLVEGRHFLSTVQPERLGHKALAVNLSDLAACGATPRAFTLALSMPRVEEAFLDGFSRGLLALADLHGIELVGGDTTAGPLNICITVFGEVPSGQALLRSGARADDDIYVSGTLGDARLALETFRGSLTLDGEAFEQARRAMELPQPRIALGQSLRCIAHSAIDVSDGFLGDLGHILSSSKVGATVQADLLPCSDLLESMGMDSRRRFSLAGGDDYELIFTAPVSARAEVAQACQRALTRATRVGRIEAAPGLKLLNAQGQALPNVYASFDHFAT